MSSQHDRRAFLAAAGVTVASVVVPRSFAQDDKLRKPRLGTREDIASMDADHPMLISYRKAIEAMKKRGKTDPLSWAFQANMHGAPEGDGDHEGWKWCMHGNWWFLPWHRGYIYYFEKIIRKMSGDDSFRLPYWGWDKEGQNILPLPFQDPKYQGKANPLFDETRADAVNKGKRLISPGRFGSFTIERGKALNTERFTASAADQSYGGLKVVKTMRPRKPASSRDHGVMESQAHNLIHVVVGGESGNMGDPDTAARDPIFWLHHANVDRLWNRWLDGRTHLLPDAKAEKDWYEQEFPFYDEDGKKVVVSVGQILELAGNESRYDDDRKLFTLTLGEKEKTMGQKIVGVGAVSPMLKLNTKPFTKTLALAEETKPRLMAALAAPPAGTEPATVLLRVEGIKPPASVPLMFEVFLAKKGEKLSQKSYVGPISFFGRHGGAGHGHGEVEGFTQGFDVTDIVHKIRSANKGDLPEMEVTVTPHSTAGLSDDDLAKKMIEVPITNITLKLVETDKE